MKNIRTCISGLYLLMRPAKKRIFLTIFFGLFRIILSLLFVWVSKVLVDIATGDQSTGKNLSFFVVVMILVVFFRIITLHARSYVEKVNVLKTTNTIRHNLFSHILRTEWKGKDSYLSGDVVNRLEEDVRVLVDLASHDIPDAIINILQLLAASLYLMTLSSNLMWILLALMVVAVLSSKLFFLRIRKLTNRIRTLDSSVQQLIQENFQNRVIVITLTGISKVLNRLSMLQDELEKDTTERIKLNLVARFFLSVGFMSGYVSAFIWGVYGIRDGLVTYGMMTALLQLVSQIQSPIVNLGSKIPSFIHALSSVERIMELQELPEEKRNKDQLLSSAPEVSINNLSFRYDEKSRMIFSNFNHIFPAGKISVISGPTGAGKSTLVKLLLALMKPTSGVITINGIPVSADTRCNFMYVPQGNTIMSGTLRDNLLLANPDASEDDLRKAIEVSCSEFVYETDNGLDTICSEDGVGLSEGQAQRITIARALLHTGNVLILDESSSALDMDTEERILCNIQARYQGLKTIIFISHRPAVFKYADDKLEI